MLRGIASTPTAGSQTRTSRHRRNKQRLGPPEPHSTTIAPRHHPVNRPVAQPASAGIPPETPHPRQTTPPQRPGSHHLNHHHARQITPRASYPHHPAEPAPPPTPAPRMAAGARGSARSWPAAPTRPAWRGALCLSSIESGSLIAASSRRAPPIWLPEVGPVPIRSFIDCRSQW